jgi:hypothetical protein
MARRWSGAAVEERRLEPQITIGLLTDARYPLAVHAFEGNTAETILWNLFVQSYLRFRGCRRR